MNLVTPPSHTREALPIRLAPSDFSTGEAIHRVAISVLLGLLLAALCAAGWSFVMLDEATAWMWLIVSGIPAVLVSHFALLYWLLRPLYVGAKCEWGFDHDGVSMTEVDVGRKYVPWEKVSRIIVGRHGIVLITAEATMRLPWPRMAGKRRELARLCREVRPRHVGRRGLVQHCQLACGATIVAAACCVGPALWFCAQFHDPVDFIRCMQLAYCNMHSFHQIMCASAVAGAIACIGAMPRAL